MDTFFAGDMPIGIRNDNLVIDENFDRLRGEKVLVTGGAGFIGSHLVRKLAQIGAEVKVLDSFDDFYPGKRANLKRFEEFDNVDLVTGSILDREVLSGLCNWSSTVFHEAGQAGIRYCNEHPEKAHRINVEGTLNVLLSCKNQPVKRVVNASSSSVYGNIESLPIGEDDPKRPDSPYAATKLAAEHYCRAFNKAYGIDVVSLRYFSVYGPSQRPDLVITTFADQIFRGEIPKVFGDGSHSRDFTFVSDIVDGTIRAALADDVGGMVFNIGKGERTTVMELLDKLNQLMGTKVEPVHAPEFPGEFPHTQADISRARKHLGYDPAISLEDGLGMYLDWFYRSRGQEPPHLG